VLAPLDLVFRNNWRDREGACETKMGSRAPSTVAKSVSRTLVAKFVCKHAKSLWPGPSTNVLICRSFRTKAERQGKTGSLFADESRTSRQGWGRYSQRCQSLRHLLTGSEGATAYPVGPSEVPCGLANPNDWISPLDRPAPRRRSWPAPNDFRRLTA
jgi:hypothetical protein